LNFEADEAGRLKAFREKFGRGWDARTIVNEEESDEADQGDRGDAEEESGNLMDLISSYGQEAEKQGTAKGVQKEKAKSRKGTGGER